jgi:hypothetical protein
MRSNWFKNKLFIAAIIVMAGGIILLFSINTSPGDTGKVKGTIAAKFTPAKGDVGTILSLIGPLANPATWMVHFDRDPNKDGTTICLQENFAFTLEKGQRVRAASAGENAEIVPEKY